MAIFESVLVLLVVAVGLAALARRWHAPYPALLAGLGIVLALLPGMPRVVLDPQLALALFVAPVLLDAAYDTSTRDLRDNWVPITALVVVAVGISTAAVAWVAKALVPDLPWAAAVALGAIVAPPDAAAAAAMLKQAGLPYRLTQILGGESLFNDATALLTYRAAVGVAMGGTLSPTTAVPTLAIVVVGSIAAGAAAGWVFVRIIDRIEDVPTSIILQFAGTFGVWIVAEHVGLSGILAVVAYAIAVARTSPHVMPARIRVPSYAVWETTVFTLNVLAFVLIGLQLRPLIEGLSPAERIAYAEVSAAVLGVVIGVRMAWVMLYTLLIRSKVRAFGMKRRPSITLPTFREAFLVGWCGMRGIVTLAAALALPAGDHPFPHRALILVAAFTVVVGTLILQGLTLTPLLAVLDLHDDGLVDREVHDARRAALEAALGTIGDDASKPARVLRYELEELLSSDAPNSPAGNGAPVQRLRRRAIDAARRKLAQMRIDETIGDDAYHRVEVVLDRSELYADSTAIDPRSEGMSG